ncbi:MAG: hypothetical protein J6T06_02380, partial [Victivallales bacterium]|nr:hypothetical protein [Victivallales bacterium]
MKMFSRKCFLFFEIILLLDSRLAGSAFCKLCMLLPEPISTAKYEKQQNRYDNPKPTLHINLYSLYP